MARGKKQITNPLSKPKARPSNYLNLKERALWKEKMPKSYYPLSKSSYQWLISQESPTKALENCQDIEQMRALMMHPLSPLTFTNKEFKIAMSAFNQSAAPYLEIIEDDTDDVHLAFDLYLKNQITKEAFKETIAKRQKTLSALKEKRFAYLSNMTENNQENAANELGFDDPYDAFDEASCDYEREACLRFVETYLEVEQAKPSDQLFFLSRNVERISKLTGSWSVFDSNPHLKRQFLAGPMNGEWDTQVRGITAAPYKALFEHYKI